jgi:hypothetical protein
MKHVRLACLLIFVSAAIANAADAPYFGKWKVNSAKSEVNDTATIEKLPSGEYRFEDQGFTYKFQLDGKEYPMPDGGTTSWKAINDTTWEATNRANGKVSAKFKITLSGDTITSAATIPQADGKELAQSATLKRVSGGPGFLGKWKAVKFDADSFWLELTPDEPDGLKLAAPNSLCVAKFDGKPYHMSGPTDPPKQTMAFRKKGAAGFEAITYLDGKIYFTDVYTVSADGKVLTDIGTAAATKKPVKSIFDRE